MAWDPLLPTDNGLLINAPGQIRDNWVAIALGTDAALLIADAKVASNAAIQESKLLFSGSGHGHTGGVGGKQIDLAAAVTGILPVVHGGTGGSTEFFKSGDWIISTVTTARSGWVNVSATYANKFIRINATPLTQGGADTHGHTNGTLAAPDHTHNAGSYLGAAHVHQWYHFINDIGQSDQSYNSGGAAVAITTAASMKSSSFRAIIARDINGGVSPLSTDYYTSSGGNSAISGNSGGASALALTGSIASGANVPAYVQNTVFQRS